MIWRAVSIKMEVGGQEPPLNTNLKDMHIHAVKQMEMLFSCHLTSLCLAVLERSEEQTLRGEFHQPWITFRSSKAVADAE